MTDMAESHPVGEHLVAELLWVHDTLRRDLGTVRAIAGEVGSGMAGGQVNAAISALRTRSPLWQLRINCLTYCRFVHAHHGAEDAMLFPALRRSNPALDPIVDRLEADHRKVSDLLDRVEELANQVATGDDAQQAGTRRELVTALEDVSTSLLEHLDLEEKSITPTLRTWTRGLW